MRHVLVLLLSLLALIEMTKSSSAETATVDFMSDSVDIALRYVDGSSEFQTILDVDNDGIAHFEFDAFAVQTFYSDEDCIIWDILGSDVHESRDVPLLATPNGLPLIALLDGDQPVAPVSLGQDLNVVDGDAGLGGVIVLQDSSIMTLEDLLNSDVSTIPRYTGNAVVSGIFQAGIVPEPTSALLLVIGLIWASANARSV